jgi:hypothetical protein
MTEFIETDIVDRTIVDSLGEMSLSLQPLSVRYCPHCTLPPEYCEFGPCYDNCLPWITANMPELLQVDSKQATSKVNGDGEVVGDNEVEEGEVSM